VTIAVVDFRCLWATPAQLDATLLYSSGACAGKWTSNVNYGMNLKARIEHGFYAGFYGELDDDVSLDVGYFKQLCQGNAGQHE
jgi:uncharacterized protein (TIGR02001 family)